MPTLKTASGGFTCQSCGKTCYLTRAQAKNAAGQLQGRWHHRYRAYRCGDYWHITSWQTADTVAYYRTRKDPAQ